MALRYLALVVALLPFVAANLSYVLSAWQGFVEWCVPYWHGCTSISAAGRNGAAYFVFKALMIPAAVLGALYWLAKFRWLALLQSEAGHPSHPVPLLCLLMGCVAAMGLVLYATVLGSIGDVYYMQRRIGVTLYFALTFFAQLLATGHIIKRSLPVPRSALRAQLAVCCAMFALGLLHLLLEMRWHEHATIDDIVEWNFALLTVLFYLTSFWMWRGVSVQLLLRG